MTSLISLRILHRQKGCHLTEQVRVTIFRPWKTPPRTAGPEADHQAHSRGVIDGMLKVLNFLLNLSIDSNLPPILSGNDKSISNYGT